MASELTLAWSALGEGGGWGLGLDDLAVLAGLHGGLVLHGLTGLRI